MYFGSELQQRIPANFYFALNRGGFLIVGKAEALQSGRNFFVPYPLKRRIFVKDGTVDPAFRMPRLRRRAPTRNSLVSSAKRRSSAAERAD
jgi:CheR methyltransferase, SAM binding domain